ncbi:MAG: 2-succinyl-5-enolpyruvyl-6-hydroxy-3-cyclohexene-1-carboxylic-acid synthase [Myxococcales bacterium]|nr:2-succinyl-5-enolpyruvyl-6-hydroxy-3-cyclohexene-1-carboxylic-acid synthase [Myxococcales bacterium]
MSTGLRNTLAGRIAIEELVRLGVHDIVIAPGSRSTPIADAAARHPGVRLRVIVDERSAAFFALGIGRATGRPAVLVTTSGSAAAHAYPAIIEADAARIPMLVFSADRPPELRGTGANQTIDQVRLFGDRVRAFVDVPCPDAHFSMRALLTTIDHVVAAAHDGPAHLNFMFRKPLDPSGAPGLAGLAAQIAPDEAAVDRVRRWLEGAHPYTRWLGGRVGPNAAALDAFAAVVKEADNGFVVAGAMDDAAERTAASRLALELGWPLVADIASGLRLGPPASNLLPFHDLMLGAPAWAAETRPDVVVRVGGPLVSKSIGHWLSCATHHVVVRPDGVRHDPAHLVSLRIRAHVSELVAAMDGRWPRPKAALRGHLRRWQAVSHEIGAAIGSVSGDEISIARDVCRALPAGAGLWAASSMSVRLLDSFAPAGGAPVAVASARGASGIDGLIAQAVGWSMARKSPCVLLLGDLAALHDIGSLQILDAEKPDLVVVVMNNGGGGIFSLLPIRQASAAFEPVFAAAHDKMVLPWADAAGLRAQGLSDVSRLPSVLAEALGRGGPHLIEVYTDRGAAQQAWIAARENVADWVAHHLQTQA